MGTLGPVLACPAAAMALTAFSLSPASAAGPDALLQGYRACLREALRTLVELEGTPTTDPRVHALTAHLARRHAAFEMEEELRRQQRERQHEQQQQQQLRRQLLDHYFRGVDLHYMASPNSR